MQRTGPLLILGAGASRPYGFPTSGQLREIILGSEAGTRALYDLGVPLHRVIHFTAGTNALTGSVHAGVLLREKDWTSGLLSLPIAKIFLDAAFEKANVAPDVVQAFRDEFFRSQRVSIDAFAQTWQEYEHVARLAIAASILLCERDARLDGDWYQLLLEAILRNKASFAAAGLEVITFNYDRSFDDLFHRALMSFCRNDPIAQAKLRNRIRLTHAYGSLGEFLGTKEGVVPYGDLKSYQTAAGNLSLARSGSGTLSPPVEDAIRKAETIVFLGFGFWPENMSLLQIDPSNGATIFASAMGLPRTVRLDIENQFGHVELGEANQDVYGFVQTHPVFAFPDAPKRRIRDYSDD